MREMQKNMLQFFSKTDKYDLPSKWVSDPLPPAAKKRCVGRPRKFPGCLSSEKTACDVSIDAACSSNQEPVGETVPMSSPAECSSQVHHTDVTEGKWAYNVMFCTRYAILTEGFTHIQIMHQSPITVSTSIPPTEVRKCWSYKVVRTHFVPRT